MYLKFFVFVLSVLFLCGCEQFQEAWEDAMNPNQSAWGKSYEPKYVMTVYQEVKYPRAGDLEAEITTFGGEKIWINTNAFFSSRNIKEIKTVPRADRPDTYNIAIRLDDRGVRIWTIMAHEFRGREMIMMIDGYFQCRFVPQILASDENPWVVIEKPFDELTAKGLEKYSKENYDFLNPSPTRLF